MFMPIGGVPIETFSTPPLTLTLALQNWPSHRRVKCLFILYVL